MVDGTRNGARPAIPGADSARALPTLPIRHATHRDRPRIVSTAVRVGSPFGGRLAQGGAIVGRSEGASMQNGARIAPRGVRVCTSSVRPPGRRIGRLATVYVLVSIGSATSPLTSSCPLSPDWRSACPRLHIEVILETWPSSSSAKWSFCDAHTWTNFGLLDSPLRSERSQPAGRGRPIRRSQRKCEASPAQNDLCSAYLIPKSRQVSSTSFEIAG